MEIIYSRVAGIDVGKREVAVAVRTPGEVPGQRRQVIRKYKTDWGGLQVASERCPTCRPPSWDSEKP